MQIKEALEFWKFKYKMTKDYNDIHWEASERREHEEYVEALKSAIEALEKRIPKKPEQTHQLNFFWCSECDRAIKKRIENSIKVISHCPYCGQALDWSEP